LRQTLPDFHWRFSAVEATPKALGKHEKFELDKHH
jgi:hypothetical protein